jgi:hypothetical protein
MNNQAAAAPTRTKNFGRTYDYPAGTVSIAVMGKPDAPAIVLDFAKLPESTQRAFALQAYADYVVQSANDAVRESGKIEDGETQIALAIESAQKEGGIEFRDGVGLGLSSAPMALLAGRALVEEGKSFIVFKGVRHEFAGDVSKAQEVMRGLYGDTDENTVDAHKLTGRQFFRKVTEVPEIAARIASYRKTKPSAAIDLG